MYINTHFNIWIKDTNYTFIWWNICLMNGTVCRFKRLYMSLLEPRLTSNLNQRAQSVFRNFSTRVYHVHIYRTLSTFIVVRIHARICVSFIVIWSFYAIFADAHFDYLMAKFTKILYYMHSLNLTLGYLAVWPL